MDKTKMLENLCQKLIDGNMDGITISDLSRQALDSGIEPLEILENGISKGMEIVGKRFETGEAFLPELIFAADAFKSAMEVISPALEASNQNVEKMGKVLLYKTFKRFGFDRTSVFWKTPTIKLPFLQ